MISIERIAEIVGGKLYGPGKGTISNVVIDSRKAEKGDLFICFKGERTDGHLFLDDAFKRGALAALVENLPPSFPREWNLIQVKSTPKSLFQLSSFWREQFHPIVVAVTGTVGKTTTKEMIATILSRSFFVLKSEGNLNTEFGVPLTLLRLREKHQFLVLEMGLQKPGDIAFLSQLAKPQVGVITQIGPAHLEFLGSEENILKEKWRLVESLPSGGIAILNRDNPYLSRAIPPRSCRAAYFSLQGKGDFNGRILNEDEEQTLFQVEAGEEEFTFNLPFRGKSFLQDFLAAFSIAYLLGVNPEEISQACASLRLVNGRGTFKVLQSGIFVVDDSYNSNPTSLSASLENFISRAKGRKIVVLGDMLELGKKAKFWHRKVGLSLPSNLDLVLLFGENSLEIKRGAQKRGFPPGKLFHFSSLEELKDFLREKLQKGDWVLVKGSRGMHLEKVVEELERIR
ncbi:MAG: UDP-N-acetylmuramoyl-tripeptide--D-alanyl-D-alanine ligase [Caldiserica bacterium]|jgi:UDP-N-acetylmuramoyl-tripeptide--D-alanyl-D-alanine ligase|nr:UDP-N-acetylmuramoyl-tripeptide--D-alanyl-D-alanine ligase [Caldisericota bacterium]MDH7562994.1 UDP-N-acetylmuramoyl-tripeptide--D-alanyl-D-alanine ligase [Caldisericota bacterium]